MKEEIEIDDEIIYICPWNGYELIGVVLEVIDIGLRYRIGSNIHKSLLISEDKIRLLPGVKS